MFLDCPFLKIHGEQILCEKEGEKDILMNLSISWLMLARKRLHMLNCAKIKRSADDWDETQTHRNSGTLIDSVMYTNIKENTQKYIFSPLKHNLTLKVLNFWKFTNYCSLKPLWSGMGEVVPARTSPTLHPPSPPTVHQLSRLAL